MINRLLAVNIKIIVELNVINSRTKIDLYLNAEFLNIDNYMINITLHDT